MRCLSCKYDLRNLSENRCPECGREFDPNDAASFFDDEHDPLREGDTDPKLLWAVLLFALLIVAFIAACAYVMDRIAPALLDF